MEGLSLDVSGREDFILSPEAFAKMTNLRLLKINSVRFTSGCYKKFSKELRWLCWHRCSLKVLPPNLDLDNLAVLDMQFSNVKKVWKETKVIKITRFLFNVNNNFMFSFDLITYTNNLFVFSLPCCNSFSPS